MVPFSIPIWEHHLLSSFLTYRIDFLSAAAIVIVIKAEIIYCVFFGWHTCAVYRNKNGTLENCIQWERIINPMRQISSTSRKRFWFKVDKSLNKTLHKIWDYFIRFKETSLWVTLISSLWLLFINNSIMVTIFPEIDWWNKQQKNCNVPFVNNSFPFYLNWYVKLCSMICTWHFICPTCVYMWHSRWISSDSVAPFHICIIFMSTHLQALCA